MKTALNPFIPESDQVQISPVASPVILHHTVWRTWLFIAYSDWKMILVPVLTTSLIHWKGWENVLFELGIERVNSSFCAVTADSKSRWPHGRKASLRGVVCNGYYYKRQRFGIRVGRTSRVSFLLEHRTRSHASKTKEYFAAGSSETAIEGAFGKLVAFRN